MLLCTQHMEKTVPFLNRCISFVAFVTALTLVVYMLVVIVTGTVDVVNEIYRMALAEPDQRDALFNLLNAEFLHNVAVLLILMKAYRVLVEYMRYHHIDIKYMVEIAIIACVLELLFNYSAYSVEMRYIFLGLAVSFLGFYVFGYKHLRQASVDIRSSGSSFDAAPKPATEKVAPRAKRTVKSKK